jgi:hypothetical protein
MLSVDSASVAPETLASHPRCNAGCAACALGPNERASATAPAIGRTNNVPSIPKEMLRSRMPLPSPWALLVEGILQPAGNAISGMRHNGTVARGINKILPVEKKHLA